MTPYLAIRSVSRKMTISLRNAGIPKMSSHMPIRSATKEPYMITFLGVVEIHEQDHRHDKARIGWRDRPFLVSGACGSSLVRLVQQLQAGSRTPVAASTARR